MNMDDLMWKTEFIKALFEEHILTFGSVGSDAVEVDFGYLSKTMERLSDFSCTELSRCGDHWEKRVSYWGEDLVKGSRYLTHPPHVETRQWWMSILTLDFGSEVL